MISPSRVTDGTGRPAWLAAAILAAAAYLLVGRLFSIPARHVRAWRLAAWLVSGVVYVAQVSWEHFARHSAPRTTASHVALAVALGALGLAAVGFARSVGTGAGIHPPWLIALVAWPAITAIPAFVVTLVLAALLRRLVASGTR